MNIDFSAPNICNFIGYLNDNPSLKHTDSGTPYMDFTLNVVRFYTRKDGGQGKERVEVPCEVWDSAASYIAEKAQEGDRLWVTTSLRKSEGNTIFRVNKFKILKRKNSD